MYASSRTSQTSLWTFETSILSTVSWGKNRKIVGYKSCRGIFFASGCWNVVVQYCEETISVWAIYKAAQTCKGPVILHDFHCHNSTALRVVPCQEYKLPFMGEFSACHEYIILRSRFLDMAWGYCWLKVSVNEKSGNVFISLWAHDGKLCRNCVCAMI